MTEFIQGVQDFLLGIGIGVSIMWLFERARSICNDFIQTIENYEE